MCNADKWMPLNIKLNDHPWTLTNCSLSITSYLNLGGEKLVKLFKQMYTLHIKHPAVTELSTVVHMYGWSLMDIMGYLDINTPLLHVHASPLTLHYLTYLPCLMVTSKLSSAAICNKNKHLQGRDKACVNTP